VFLPLVAVSLLVMAARDLPSAVRAARGDGLAGTFVAEVRHCGRGSCSWEGTFTSADGSVRLADVTLGTDTPRRPGDRVAALMEDGPDAWEVYLADGDRTWIWILAIMTATAGHLVWCGWWLIRGRGAAAARGRHSGSRRDEPHPVWDGSEPGTRPTETREYRREEPA
jgi:hypothetical protein